MKVDGSKKLKVNESTMLLLACHIYIYIYMVATNLKQQYVVARGR